MRRLRFFPVLLACLLLLPACKSPAPSTPVVPLTWGDAEWPQAPIPQPGGDGSEGGGDGDTEGGSGLTFVPSSGDLASIGECDPFSQDCPEGEKCVAYASTGGNFDANKCVPVTGANPAGELCVYGGVVEATDDCDALSYCWDAVVNMDVLEGACAGFCQGTPDNPVCPDGQSCLIDYEGSVALCLDDADGTDTGTDTDTGLPDIEDPQRAPDPLAAVEEVEQICPDTTDPIVLYMSNDDSNSQASPALVRRLIHEGNIVNPNNVRIHEFLNYYQIATDYPLDTPASLGMQMRRTNDVDGDFALLLYAQGQLMRETERPPMNLVFSLDTSGSMGGESIELVKASMMALAGRLRAGDVISLVAWSSDQVVVLDSHAVTGADDPALVSAITWLDTGGSTGLHDGLVRAYQLAEANHIDGGINRVIIMSDGGANAGITDIDLIASAAAAEDGSGTYLVGVGVAPAAGYRDELMDTLTDAGKGAYIFIDDPAEAQLQFTDRFLANVGVAARNVKMRVTLPWYFGVKSFHGEEYSADPTEVEPQHLAPNDSMNFHQIISACDPGSISANDTIETHIEYLHPLTLEPMQATMSRPLGQLVEADATQLYKADVVVGFAKAIIVIGARKQGGDDTGALTVAQDMAAWLAQAAQTLDDPEVEDMAEQMAQYAAVL